MRPACYAVLYHCGDHGRARRVEHAFFNRVLDDLAVRCHDAGVQECGHIVQFGFGLGLVERRYRLQCQLCRDLALRVPAHAVGQQQQTRIAGVAVTHAVFVELASTLATDLEYGKFHFGLATELAMLLEFFLVSVTMVSN